MAHKNPGDGDALFELIRDVEYTVDDVVYALCRLAQLEEYDLDDLTVVVHDVYTDIEDEHNDSEDDG